MESLYVFNYCVCFVLAVLLCSVTVVKSQDFGSGGSMDMCDGANPCTAANEICVKLDPDMEATCILDPCVQGTLENADCTTSQMCVSAANCNNWNGACTGLATNIGNTNSYRCVDPCTDPIYCATGSVCSFDIMRPRLTRLMCGTANNTMTGDVCSGVDCNLGTCSSQQDSNGVIAAQCTCNEGAISKNLTYCDTQENLVAETQSENTQLYSADGSIRVVNYPWVEEYNDPTSAVYMEYVSKFTQECIMLYGNYQGFLGCQVIGLSPGSIRTQYRLYFDNQEITEQILTTDLMGNLTQRISVQTGEVENWWGTYLQVDETSIVIQPLTEVAAPTSSSALLPAVLGSSLAIVVIILSVVLLYYFGRVWRNRYYAGTYDDSEDTETTYQTRSTPQYFYTRNNPQHYGWGLHGRPNYWSASPSQQQGSWGERQWFWKNRDRGVYTAS